MYSRVVVAPSSAAGSANAAKAPSPTERLLESAACVQPLPASRGAHVAYDGAAR